MLHSTRSLSTFSSVGRTTPSTKSKSPRKVSRHQFWLWLIDDESQLGGLIDSRLGMNKALCVWLCSEQPIVQIEMPVDWLSMKNGTHSCGDSGELSRHRGKTEWESLELVGLVIVKQAEILPGSWLDRHMEISILEIYGGDPLALVESFPYSPLGLHFEFLLTTLRIFRLIMGRKPPVLFGTRNMLR